MVGRAGRSGRPVSATRKVAYQVRLEVLEAEAFDELVRRREAEVSDSGATANASRVLRSIVRKALLEEGLLPDPAIPGPAATPPKPRRTTAQKR